MSKFNYFPTTPYTNPDDEFEKQTNEIPKELKTKTTAKRRTSKTRQKVKKVVEENK